MAAFSILSRFVQFGPDDHVVTVSANAVEASDTVASKDTAPMAPETPARRNFLIMSLASEMRA